MEAVFVMKLTYSYICSLLLVNVMLCYVVMVPTVDLLWFLVMKHTLLTTTTSREHHYEDTAGTLHHVLMGLV